MKTKSAIPGNPFIAILPVLAIFTQLAVSGQSGASVGDQGGYSNVATGKTATASSSDNAANAAMYAVDGNINTRFSSAYSDNQWLSLDLGKSYLISAVILTWEQSYGKDFDIVFSNTGTFTDLPAVTVQVRNHTLANASIAGTDTLLTRSNTIARYVRMQGINRATNKGYSIWEMQVMGATSSTNLLPVSVTGFNATVQSGAGVLEWMTVTEYSNAGFSIERSSDGSNFNAVGWVSARNAGSVTTHYAFTDKQAVAGKNYYRLKQTWLDGKIGYSGIISITVAGSSTVNIYPVPVKDRIVVECSATAGENISITLFNGTGLPVYTSKMVAQGMQQALVINRTAGMTAGEYFLSISAAGNKYIKKIILQ